jgi:hypothetical protein
MTRQRAAIEVICLRFADAKRSQFSTVENATESEMDRLVPMAYRERPILYQCKKCPGYVGSKSKRSISSSTSSSSAVTPNLFVELRGIGRKRKTPASALEQRGDEDAKRSRSGPSASATIKRGRSVIETPNGLVGVNRDQEWVYTATQPTTDTEGAPMARTAVFAVGVVEAMTPRGEIKLLAYESDNGKKWTQCEEEKRVVVLPSALHMRIRLTVRGGIPKGNWVSVCERFGSFQPKPDAVARPISQRT